MSSLKIIYVAGSGHSGSTLLGRLLDQHPKITSIGSIDGIRLTLDGENRFCGCGAHAQNCLRWGQILTRLQQEGITDGSGLKVRAPDFAHVSERVLRAISDAGGGSQICEATHSRKRPWRYVRAGIANVCVIHLVRDPRGVAFSYERKGQSIWGLVASLYRNALTHELSRLQFGRNPRVKYRRVHYEELCADPEKTLREIVQLAGLSAEGLDLSTLTNGQSHLLQGNRMRHRPLGEIRQSTSFATKTTASWWGIATALTLPLLLRYGYPVFRAKIAPRPREAARLEV